MDKLDRYIARTVLMSMLLVIAVIVGLHTLFDLMAQLGDMRADYQYVEVLRYLALTMPRRVYEVTPVSALIGCLIGLGTLAKHSELIVIRAAGISLLRIGWSVLKPACLLIVTALLLGEFVIPDAEHLARSERQIARQGGGQYVDEGVWYKEGGRYIYLTSIDTKGRLYGVSLFEFSPEGQLQESIYAEQALYEQDQWILHNVDVTTYHSDKAEHRTASRRVWDSELTQSLLRVLTVSPEALSMRGLAAYIDYLDQQHIRSDEYALALYDKMLQPVATFALLLIAMSFMFGPLRSVSMGGRLFAGVITGVVFMLVQRLLGPMSLTFGVNPLLAVSLPIVVCFCIGAILMCRSG